MNLKHAFAVLIAAVGILSAQSARADLISSAEVLYFGIQPQGSNTGLTVTLINNGIEALTNVQLSLTSDDFILGQCPTILYPGGSCPLQVVFHPNRPGKFRKKLTVDADSASGSYSAVIRLEGETAK